MFQRLVVPLDGSQTAAAVLPRVKQFAESLGSQVELITVIPLDTVATKGFSRAVDVAGELKRYAESYLRQASAGLGLPAGRVKWSTTLGDVAPGIVEAAERERDTLLVMSTHGRSGIGRFLLGSIAANVLHSTNTPLFLHRSAALDAANGLLQTVIVPLDGSERAEGALPVASSLAKAMGLQVTLVRVRRSMLAYGFNATSSDVALEEHELQESQRYLEDKAQPLSREGLNVSVKTLAGSPAAAIIDHALAAPHAFVAMTTRGRSGAARATLGSVADRVATQGQTPVLLIKA